MDARACRPSSPIPAALIPLTHTDPRQPQDVEASHLLAYLAGVPTPELPVAAARIGTILVLAQRQVGGAPKEVPALAPLLAPLDLAGVVGHRRRAADPP